jgi:hypothetical protein
MACKIASNNGADALSMTIEGSCCFDQSGLQQVDLRTSVHLAFHQIQFGDLPSGLTVRPGFNDGGTNGGFVPFDACGKGRDRART